MLRKPTPPPSNKKTYKVNIQVEEDIRGYYSEKQIEVINKDTLQILARTEGRVRGKELIKDKIKYTPNLAPTVQKDLEGLLQDLEGTSTLKNSITNETTTNYIRNGNGSLEFESAELTKEVPDFPKDYIQL